MTEKLLQYIWQFQYFNKSSLQTTSGEVVEVIAPGQHNLHQGPDFLNAKIRVGAATWAGSVELHFKSSEWQRHKHHQDPNYANVVLHVVWQEDRKHRGVPVIELRDRVSKILLTRFEELMNNRSFIACESSIHLVNGITWLSWKDRLLAGRLMRKAKAIESLVLASNLHWEEIFWRIIARNFGAKVNSETFEEVATSLPLNLLARHKNQIHHLEAFLFGQANFLDQKYKDDYANMLFKEYRFFKDKYKLRPCNNPVHFLRMRPGNFPTIRLAQLAALIHKSEHLFSKVKNADSIDEVRAWLDVTANDYWHYRYRFDEPSPYRPKQLGKAMIDNVMINTIVPMLFAYGNYHDQEVFRNKALQWLEATSAENNFIVSGFDKLHIQANNAFDSQSLIELKNEFCNQKRCLECSVGNFLLR